MAIMGLFVENGLEISRSELDRIGAIVAQNLQMAMIKAFKPGTYDITPENFRDPAFNYLLHVKADGTGALEMQPRYDDSLAYEPVGHMMPDDPSQIMHSQIKPINADSEMVAIAGPRELGIALFAIIIWVENSA